MRALPLMDKCKEICPALKIEEASSLMGDDWIKIFGKFQHCPDCIICFENYGVKIPYSLDLYKDTGRIYTSYYSGSELNTLADYDVMKYNEPERILERLKDLEIRYKEILIEKKLLEIEEDF
jgi:hypothetical protein